MLTGAAEYPPIVHVITKPSSPTGDSSVTVWSIVGHLVELGADGVTVVSASARDADQPAIEPITVPRDLIDVLFILDRGEVLPLPDADELEPGMQPDEPDDQAEPDAEVDGPPPAPSMPALPPCTCGAPARLRDRTTRVASFVAWRYRAECTDCGRCGRYANNADEAAAAWLELCNGLESRKPREGSHE